MRVIVCKERPTQVRRCGSPSSAATIHLFRDQHQGRTDRRPGTTAQAPGPVRGPDPLRQGHDMTEWLWIGYERMVDKDHRPPPVKSAKDPDEGVQAASGPQAGELAAELRRIRLAAGLSRVQIAQEVGLPESDLSRLETGQVTPRPAKWLDGAMR